jgi:hypothetical protein
VPGEEIEVELLVEGAYIAAKKEGEPYTMNVVYLSIYKCVNVDVRTYMDISMDYGRERIYMDKHTYI